MGGRPRTALSILCFPSETLDGEIMYQLMKGAMETLAQANCSLVGGHSIKDPELKLGFAVTGTIDPQKVVALSAMKPGDLLVLTKPLGVGVLSFARQIGRNYDAGLAAAARSMSTLNKAAAEAMEEAGVNACTDITGFGLFGHLLRMARKSGLAARIYADRLPVFEGVLEALRDGVIPGAVERNQEFAGPDLLAAPNVDEISISLGFDAQTSGGLLLAVSRERHGTLLTALQKRGVTAATIGEVIETSRPGTIELLAAAGDSLAAPSAASSEQPLPVERAEDTSSCCCAETSILNDPGAGTGAASLRAFGELMRTTSAAGVIDLRAKELIQFALVILSRCDPCLKLHWEKARQMGISEAELDEAAWLAAAMGGAPVRMFYTEFLEQQRRLP